MDDDDSFDGGAEGGEGGDAGNSTVFVGGLDPALVEADLRKYFEPFGELVYVKIPAGKGCGFVQFVHRSCAEQSIAQLNGTAVGASRVRLSWVRSNSSAAGRGGGGGGVVGFNGTGPGGGGGV